MSNHNNVEQVKDDPELLKLMMKDSSTQSELYRPTKYWANYEKSFMPELLSLGLKDFRRRKNSILNTFGATDLSPFSISTRFNTSSLVRSFLLNLFKIKLKIKKMQKGIQLDSDEFYSSNDSDINYSCYQLAKSYGEEMGAKPVQEFEASIVGNPENIFYVNKKLYTISLLSYYVMYAYCCKFMSFDSINFFMEIGNGSGKQIEVIKKLYPNLSFFIFDIPPQLYVAEQYLSAIFPDSVVSYRKTREMNTIPDQCKGKIFIFGNWKISELKNFEYDMFWNSTSFQEMEPHVVLNYLKYVNQQTKKYIFLHLMPKGVKKNSKNTSMTVNAQTKLKHYTKGLNNFQIIDNSTGIRIPRVSPYTPYRYLFWNHK